MESNAFFRVIGSSWHFTVLLLPTRYLVLWLPYHGCPECLYMLLDISLTFIIAPYTYIANENHTVIHPNQIQPPNPKEYNTRTKEYEQLTGTYKRLRPTHTYESTSGENGR